VFIQVAWSAIEITLAIAFAVLFVFFASVVWRVWRNKSGLKYAAQFARVHDELGDRPANAKDVLLGRIDVSGQAKANFAVQRAFVATKAGAIAPRGRLSDEMIDTIR
jgi:hypothetical protein